MFYIDIESKNIESIALSADAGPNSFSSEGGLMRIAEREGWSKEQVTAIWNILAVAQPYLHLKRQMMFKNRPYGIAAIWKAIQRLRAGEDVTPQPKPERVRKAARRPKAEYRKGLAARNAQAAKSSEPREGSKKAQVIAMLQRKGGASNVEISNEMGWLAKTTSALITKLRAEGFATTAVKDEKRGVVYQAA